MATTKISEAGQIQRSKLRFGDEGALKWDSLPEIASVQSSDYRKIPFEAAALCIGH
jgi:hypothetical protein